MDREKMRLRLDVNNMMDTFVGEHGISQAGLRRCRARRARRLKAFRQTAAPA